MVVQSDLLNDLEGYPNTIIVPLTTKERNSPTFVKIVPSPQNGLDRESWAITNQVFTVGKDSLGEPIGQVSGHELQLVRDALIGVVFAPRRSA